MRRFLSVVMLFASFSTAACSAAQHLSAPANVLPQSSLAAPAINPDNTAMLVSFDNNSDRLVAMPLQKGGGSDPEPISGRLGIGFVASLAAIGDVVVMAEQYPPSVVLYNVQTQVMRTLPDPFGTPVDIAVGKDRSIYLQNFGSKSSPVTWYPASSHRPVELNCGLVQLGEAVAVDNEGDIFVDGYAKYPIVAEIPNGPNGPEPQNCTKLPLKSGAGYVGGVYVNPKNDDLLTLDDPSLCAGGPEGRLTTYPKPYNRDTGHSRVVGNNCSGGLRMDAESNIVLIGDTDVSQSNFFILQRGYPDGSHMGIYNGIAGGWTTIPNSLPN